MPGGAVFYEGDGELFTRAGFAYLPGGPTADIGAVLFESLRFRHLGGGWYLWTGGDQAALAIARRCDRVASSPPSWPRGLRYEVLLGR
ncbi:hypothetical protein GCM10007977_054140 [Dactylosporangium sucinum]|uniref:Uncharacterized protein n=1 Tax=Dactylosporangium sucinum TaxID=1424081 RepID=A0A917U056_9ACTN|nr:hypothetical protein GCM10007977_054140 [Dactylosporangium sucinum]